MTTVTEEAVLLILYLMDRICCCFSLIPRVHLTQIIGCHVLFGQLIEHTRLQINDELNILEHVMLLLWMLFPGKLNLKKIVIYSNPEVMEEVNRDL